MKLMLRCDREFAIGFETITLADDYSFNSQKRKLIAVLPENPIRDDVQLDVW